MASLTSFRAFWNEWDLRILVMLSLLLQVILILAANLRKKTSYRLVIGTLWSAYLLADLVATYSLGVLSRSQIKLTTEFTNLDIQLTALWAPFLLLHLGGPDVITAFSLADNELWLRHGINLVTQVFLAGTILARYYLGGQIFLSSILVFVVGLFKYGERTWALKCGSMDGLRISMLGKPDPGPDYVNPMNQYTAKLRAGLPAAINVQQAFEEGLNTNVATSPPVADSANQQQQQQQDTMMIQLAFEFYKKFKGLFVESMFSFRDREKSRSFFLATTAEWAFKVVEIELSFAYDVLYTKSSVSRTSRSLYVRGVTLTLTFAAALSFVRATFPELKMIFKGLNKGLEIRLCITCALFLGAILIEIFSFFRLVVSDWTIVLTSSSKPNNVVDGADSVPESNQRNLGWMKRLLLFLCPVRRQRWSDMISQYNLLGFCLNDRRCPPSIIKKIVATFGVKEITNNYFYTHHVKVRPELRNFIFEELVKRSKDAKDFSNYRFVTDCKGGWTLEKEKLLDSLGWSILDAEFDESLLIWHIACDLCFRTCNLPLLKEESDDSHKKIAEELSNYLLYLLVVCPMMLASTAVVGVKKYDDTCAEVAEFFKREPKNLKELDACKLILDMNTDHRPVKVKGDRCKSVLWDGCELAKALMFLKEKKWEIMSKVLFEMVCYTAIHCRGYYHAEQLSRGGELLTFTWFLLNHFGMGKQFMIETGASSAYVVEEFS